MKKSEPAGIKAMIMAFREKFEEDKLRFKDLPGVTTNWSPEKLVRLYEAVHVEEMTQDEVAEEFDIDRSTVSRKDNSMSWDKFLSELDTLTKLTMGEYLDKAATIQKTKIEEKSAIGQRRKIIDVLARLKEIEEKVIRAVTPTPQIWLPKFAIRKDAGGTPEHMVLLLSDQHVGLGFNREETGGLAEYNQQVYLRRVDNLRKGLYEIYRLHSRLYPIPELHIFGLGDFVQGGNLNGEWGPAYQELSIDQQAIIAADTTAELVLSWEPLFEKIRFMGVIGNHGRAGVSKNSDKVSANWDNMVYAILKGRLSGHPKITVEATKSWWMQKRVLNTEILAVHGDKVPNNLNSMRAKEEQFQSMISSCTDKFFDIMCLGHFHNHSELETSHGMVIVNGSFIGGDMYSMWNLTKKSRPTQTLFGVHPERGLTWKYRLDMDLKRDDFGCIK